jgi:hypothetical protein
MDQAAIAEATSEELGAAVEQVQAIESATIATKLELISICDERKTWVEDGCASMESWIAQRLGVAWRTGAELLRVARALESRPALTELFASGGLSWDKLRALVVFTTPSDEAEWAERAPAMTVAELERAARAARERSEAAAAAAHHGRELRFRAHPELPVKRVSGWIPNDMAAVIEDAIDREASRLPLHQVEEGIFEPYRARRVDALFKICSQALGADGDADRSTVLLYEQPDGSTTLADGTCLHDSAAEWMRCDCREQHADGSVNDAIPRALRRKILRRYGHCMFPGCEQRRWLQIHHVIHRSKGGPTVEWNLRPECPFHHRVIHKPGWRVKCDEDGELHYFRPDGNEVTTNPPPPLRPDVRARVDRWMPFTEGRSPFDCDDTS